jgi:hypothetical protein
VARAVLVALLSVPLLTELVSSKTRFGYRQGAPNGAVPAGQHLILPRTAKNLQPGLRKGECPLEPQHLPNSGKSALARKLALPAEIPLVWPGSWGRGGLAVAAGGGWARAWVTGAGYCRARNDSWVKVLAP